MKNKFFSYFQLLFLIILLIIFFYLELNFSIPGAIFFFFLGLILFLIEKFILLNIVKYFFTDGKEINSITFATMNIVIYFLIYLLTEPVSGEYIGFAFIWVILSYGEYYRLTKANK